MEEKEEEEYAVVPLNAPGIHDATDILAKYNRKDVHWDHVNDALKYEKLFKFFSEKSLIVETGLKKDGTVTTSFQYVTFTSPSE